MPPRRVAALLFGSGLAALIYQTAWLRELRFVFGASTAASAAVLAVFMGGLGVGAVLLSRRAAQHPRPLLYYARLEAGVAVAAACSPLLIQLVRRVYIALGGTLLLGAWAGTVLRLALAALVLLVPTILAGGTLPAAVQAVERREDTERRATGLLYGANTLGALTGCLLSTFVLHERFGVRTTLLAGCALNAAVAAIAAYWGRARQAPARAPAAIGAAMPIASAREASPVLITATVVGFVFFLMEIVWYRMLSPILGGSSYTFGLILAIVLLGIGLGGLAYANPRWRRPLGRGPLALTCALEGCALVVPFAIGDPIAIWALRLRQGGGDTFGGLVLGWALITAIVVLPAAFISGYQFPLLVASLGAEREVGEKVGLAYAWNTVGAIAGSLIGGFGVLPLLSAPGAWRLCTALLALTAAWLAWRAPPRPGASPAARWAAPLCAVVSVALLAAPGPTGVWRHGGVGVGRAPSPDNVNAFMSWRNLWRRAIVWEHDGLEGCVALVTDLDTAFILNGKSDGSARRDAGTQVMSGLLPALLHPAPRRALVIGLGTGSTAGWLGAIPDMDRVDVFELEPVILKVARAMEAVNRHALDNPKVHVVLGDARELLLTAKERYDIIFSEPSNPYRSGISSMFTREFYQAAAQRLDDAGLFVQWLQAYDVDRETISTVFATLRSVFPKVETWSTQGGDLMLVASRHPIVHDLTALRARIQQTPFREGLYATWRVVDIEGVLAHFFADSTLADRLFQDAAGAYSTDDHTLVEFGFARSVGRTVGLQELERIPSETRPAFTNGTVDWNIVADRWLTMLAQNDRSSPPQMGMPDGVRQRAQALNCWVAGNLACARLSWQQQDEAPRDPVEQLLLAEALADAAAPAALDAIEAVKARSAVEGSVLEARYLLRKGAPDGAIDALARAFTAYRTDPWPLLTVMKRALLLAPEAAAQAPAGYARLAEALGEPFAVSLLDSARRASLAEVTLTGPDRGRCVEALKPLEPFVPWTRPLLEARVRCYRDHPSPWRDRARLDRARYIRYEQ